MTAKRKYNPEVSKRFYIKNLDKLREKARETYHNKTSEQKKQRLDKLKLLRINDPIFLEKERKRSLKSRMKLKEIVINQYGGKCKCCNETELEFLSIDHINNDGNFHRKTFTSGSKSFYLLIKDKNEYDLYQVLCFNCNWSKRLGKGKCIHERNKRI